MADVPSHSSAWVRGVVHLFASQGVDSGWLLREAGIEPERLKHSHERFKLSEVDRALQDSADRTVTRASLVMAADLGDTPAPGAGA